MSPEVIITSEPPFTADAFVIEEDTGLVLSAEVAVDPRHQEHPIRVMTDLLDFEIQSPGAIVVQEGHPLKILAVVADFDCTPPVDEKWTREALTSALDECERRGFTSVAIQMLGTRFNHEDEEPFVTLFNNAIRDRTFDTVRQIWLVRNPSA